MDNKAARKKLITEAFFKLFVVNVFIIFAQNINNILDGVFVGQFLGTKALAAVGFFAPYTSIIGLTNVIAIGAQIVIGNYIGAGERKKVDDLFFSNFMFLVFICITASIASIVFRFPLASLLGAAGETKTLLGDYIIGFVPGIVFQVLVSYLTGLVSYNNDLKKSYMAIGVMVIVNVLGDIFLGQTIGILGIGIASSLSSFAAFITLMISFAQRAKTLSITRIGFDFSLILKVLLKGLPAAAFSIGMVIKTALINSTLNVYAGTDGVAVSNVFNTVTGFICPIPVGCYNAFLSLSVIYYGDDDKESFIDLMRIALRFGTALCTCLIIILMLISRPFALLFFAPSDSAYEMATIMLLILPSFILPNVVFYLFVKAYQAEGHDLFVNVFSLVDPALTGIFIFFAVPTLGITAGWFGTLFASSFGLVVIAFIVIFSKKKLTFSLEDMLMLDPKFGAPKGTFAEFTLTKMDDVASVSQKIISFLKEKGSSTKEAMYVGLCSEELSNNILRHGFKNKKNYSVDIRVVKRDTLSLRFRDDCPEFDPKARMDSLNPQEPEKNIGMRIVSKMAKDVSYYNNAGINTLLLKF